MKQSRGSWRRLDKRTVFTCPYYAVAHDRYERADGRQHDYYYVDLPGSTMVIPRDSDGKFVMVRQFRYLVGRFSTEFPGGALTAGVEPKDNAARELREEAGLCAASLQLIGKFAPYNGVSNEICHVYSATDLTRVPPEPEPTEEIEILEMHPDEVARQIASGEIWDGMTIAAYALFVAAL